MNTVTLDDEEIRKKLTEFLSTKFANVENVPRQISKTFPFLDTNQIFEIHNKKVALLIEREIRTPRWVDYIKKHSNVLEDHNFEIGIITYREKANNILLPKYPDISRAFSAECFGLYLVRGDDFQYICHKKLVDCCEKMSETQVSPLQRRLSENKHIPEKVIQAISCLSNSFLSNSLKDIAVEYEATRFTSSDMEYDFVQKAMCDILQLSQLQELERQISFLRWTEKQLQSMGRRDHFLHSFQVFLLGETIIDKHVESLIDSGSERNQKQVSFERTWLLASLLHDTGFPFQHREWIDSVDGIVDFDIDLVEDSRTKHFLDDLAVLFSTVKTSSEEKVKNLLYKQGRERSSRGQSRINHGLISATQLLRKSMNVSQQIYKNEILPAALAMALHDRGVWFGFVEEGLAPFDICNFPIVSLLILCDHMEGWGRPGRKVYPRGGDVILTDLNINSGNVNVKLFFNETADALMFRWETEEIFSNLVKTVDLFNLSLISAIPE